MRMLNNYGQMENVKQEANRLNVNILAVSWPKNGNFAIDNHSIIYTGVEKSEIVFVLILDQDIWKRVL